MPSSAALVHLIEQAIALCQANELGRADQACRQALALRPRCTEALHLLGLIAYRKHHYDSAVALMQQALAMERGKPHQYADLALVFQAQGNLEKAVQAARRAVKQHPANAVFHSNLGRILQDAGEIDAALVSFERASALDERLPAGHIGRAICLLTTGRIAEAWPEYAWRADHMRQFGNTRGTADEYGVVRHAAIRSSDLQGKRILLVREQGLGDELFFLRYAPLIKTATAASLTYVGSPKLAALLKGHPSLDMFVEYGATAPEHDTAFAIGDLPLLANAAEPPHGLPLAVTERARTQAQERLSRSGPPPYLGVTWRAGRDLAAGSPIPLRKHIRVESFARAVSSWRGTCVVLQRGPLPGEVTTFSNASGLHTVDFSDCNDDLELMLAVLEQIDEYVGVSNTNTHLCAGLFRSQRVLVPSPPEWRWTLKLEQSPWFRGFPLYREEAKQGWDTALRRLAADLSELNEQQYRGATREIAGSPAGPFDRADVSR